MWIRSRNLTCSSIGRRTSHCICFAHIDQKRAKLCANREGSTQHNFRIKKFHQYLYGRKFLLVTDHKPLTTLLGPKIGIPALAAARMQRWALLLAAYRYDIEYRSTAKHANADCLSRLPQQVDMPHDEVNEVKLLSPPQRFDGVGYVYPLNEVSAGAKAERVDLAANLCQKHVVFLYIDRFLAHL